MSNHYQTPGVYYERVDSAVAGVTAIATDVAGFVGIAERGPINTPVPIQSWRQFEAHFGSFSSRAYLAYAVRGFFENGGRRCYVVRVASVDTSGGAKFSGFTLYNDNPINPTAVWRLKSSSPGTWGHELSIKLRQSTLFQTTTKAIITDGKFSYVESTSGFSRGSLVRLSQGSVSAFHVVNQIDGIEKRLVWEAQEATTSLPYDKPLTGFHLEQSIVVESIEYTLVVYYKHRAVATYEGLSLIPEHYRYGPLNLAEPDYHSLLQPQAKISSAPSYIIIEEQRAAFNLNNSPRYRTQLLASTSLDNSLPTNLPHTPELLTGGQDGLSLLSAEDFIGEEASPIDSDYVKKAKTRGVRVLNTVNEVALIAIPDINIQAQSPPLIAPLKPCIPDPCLPTNYISPLTSIKTESAEMPPLFSTEEIYRVQAEMINICELRRDRIALLDAPFDSARQEALGISEIRAWRQRYDSAFAVLNFPWLTTIDPLRLQSSGNRIIPPSGHVAGLFAQSELHNGVHKAPANVALSWVQNVTITLDDERHGLLNHLGVNVIRNFSGRGIRVFGARTLSSDPDWRYINVRRLLLMIAKAIYLSVQWAAFEPNNHVTHNKLRLSLMSFFIALWQQGALVGDSIEQAFFVKCDSENNPSTERNNGRLWIHIGVARSKPFEFIVLRVGRFDNAFEITSDSQ